MDQNFYEEVDKLLNVIRRNLEPVDFMPQFGFHESNMKYAFCWALEKAAVRSFRTEVSLPIYPQSPHLRGKGKVKSIIDLAVEIGDLLIGFEFKTDNLSRISQDDMIAYIKNLSCIFFTCLGRRTIASIGPENVGKAENFWLCEFEKFSGISGSFGLLSYEFNTGSLLTLKKPSCVGRKSQCLYGLKFSEEDGLKYRVWRDLKREGYKVVSEPKPKNVEFEEVTLISAPPRRKYIYPYIKRIPKIKRIDLIAIKNGETIGVEVKADLNDLSSAAQQLEQYLKIYDLDTLYMAVPIRLIGKAKALIPTSIILREKIKIWGISSGGSF